MTYKLQPFSTSTNETLKPYWTKEPRFHFSISRTVASLKEKRSRMKEFNIYLIFTQWLLLLGTSEAKLCQLKIEHAQEFSGIKGYFRIVAVQTPFLSARGKQSINNCYHFIGLIKSIPNSSAIKFSVKIVLRESREISHRNLCGDNLFIRGFDYMQNCE